MRVLRWSALALLVVLLAAAGFVFAFSADYPPAPRLARLTRFEPLPLSATPAPTDRVLVVLVFDGLAPALVRAVATPHLDRLAQQGAHTLSMTPVFPTLSLPNHDSLLTGCFPARHGVVSNRFIDPARGLFSGLLGDALWLEDCEPLSEVAERQGVRTWFLGWVGAQRGHQLLVSHGFPLEADEPDIDTRIEQVLGALPEAGDPGSRLIVGYMTEPDHTLHEHGVDSGPARAKMREVDAAVGRVMDAIGRRGLWNRTALVVTTDHGMIDAGKHLNVERVLRERGVSATIAASGSIAHVYLDEPATRAAAVRALSGDPRFDVIVPGAAAQNPAWANLGRSPRLGDFVISLHPGYHVFDRGAWPAYLRWAAPYGPEVLSEHPLVGMHGYPPDTPGIQAVLFAGGAGIARGVELAGLRVVDVHPTLCRWLSIEPGRPVDGVVFDPMLAATSP